MEKHCQIKFDENLLIINGLDTNSMIIDINGDIDVTSLVEKLIHLIDNEDSIVLDTQEDASWDDKKKMIYKLVYKIFEKYNACLTENDEESAPINNINSEERGNAGFNSSLSTGDNADDLPF